MGSSSGRRRLELDCLKNSELVFCGVRLIAKGRPIDETLFFSVELQAWTEAPGFEALVRGIRMGRCHTPKCKLMHRPDWEWGNLLITAFHLDLSEQCVGSLR